LQASRFGKPSILNTSGELLSAATPAIMEENNPRFFAHHMGVNGDGVDARLA
jgi:hypothetical protein